MRRFSLLIVALVAIGILSACTTEAASPGIGADNPKVVPSSIPDNDLRTGATLPLATDTHYVIPEVIDNAYLFSLVHAFDHLYGNAVRTAKQQSGDPTESAAWQTQMQALTTEKQFSREKKYWSKFDEIKHPLRQVPGDPVTTIEQVVQASRSCIVLRVFIDPRLMLQYGSQNYTGKQQYIAFILAKNGANPTPWVMNYRGAEKNGKVPKNACRA